MTLVSVVMGVYNGKDTLERSVRSALQQTYKNLEFIVVDDGSTDGSSEILLTLAAQDSRINIITQRNTGLTKSLNIGVRAAKGELIARLDADDYAATERIEKQVAAFQARPELVLLGSNSLDQYENASPKEWGHLSDAEIEREIILCTPFPHSTVMFRADVFRKLGGYNESFVTSQDTELWMRFAKQGKVSMLPECLIERTVHSGSISHSRRFRQFNDAWRARRMHYEGSSLYAFYFSLRSLIITFIPQGVIRALKECMS
jgi:glycosyltransferase involved in cell wall biosynthesis